MEKIKILDCSIRDGGYLNDWKFTRKIVKNIYRAVSDAGIDFFEIGFLNPYDSTKGIWHHVTNKDIQDVTRNYSGAKIGVMINFGKTKIQDVPDSDNTSIDMIRVAVHKNKIKEALAFCEQIKDKGYLVSIQMMGYSTLTGQEQHQVYSWLRDSDIDYAYIADSYGSLKENELKTLLQPLLNIPNIKIGFHAHNNLQYAFANVLTAINMGIDIVDGSIAGRGRGAGNLPIELLVAEMEHRGQKYNSKPLYIHIDKNYPDYNLQYALSGIYNVHPYFIKHLLEDEKYSLDETIDKLKEIEKTQPIGFSQELLDELMDNEINLELTKTLLDKKTQDKLLNSIQLPKKLKKLVNIYERISRYRVLPKYKPYEDRIKSFKDIYKGERCFIVGTGPSLKKTRFDLINDEILFGVNTLFRGLEEFGINPQYYVLGDPDVFHAHHKQLLSLDTIMFLSGGPGHYFLNNKKYYSNGSKADVVPIKRLGRMTYDKDFSRDIAKGVYSSGTVILLCLQIAWFMGFKDVYLLGCDCDYSGDHHYDGRRTIKKEEPVMSSEYGKQRVFKGYNICKKAFESDGRHIYNSTVKGKLEVFERKGLEEIK